MNNSETTGMRETWKPDEAIEIPDTSYEAFVTLLEYLYTDIIPDHLTTDTAVELLISAERYSFNHRYRRRTID